MLEIIYRPTEQLIPYANNARTHSEQQVAQIAASIREYGFTNPVLIDEEGGIIAGHGRVMAARLLNKTEVPTITLAGLSDQQKRAYILADNKIALNSGWDDDLLKIELDRLQSENFDVSGIGFSADELNLIFNGWDSDINVVEKHGENLDGIGAVIKIEISPEQKQFAHEVITNALDSSGIEYAIQ